MDENRETLEIISERNHLMEKKMESTQEPCKEQSKPESLKHYWYPSHGVVVDQRVTASHRGVWALSLFTVATSFAAAVLVTVKDRNLPDGVVDFISQTHVIYGYAVDGHLLALALALVVVAAVVIGGVLWWLVARKQRPVYLVDFSVLYPPDTMKMSKELFVQQSKATGRFSDELLAFQERVVSRTGLGDETYLPRSFIEDDPSHASMALAREEALDTITGCCDDLFNKTGVHPREIDFVVCNCSLFCPTPSMASMIMNHYKMRSNVKNYQLGGMGCSAGLISIDLARDLLRTYPNSTVLVFSTENITMNWYGGDVKGMLLSNTLFRVGGAAILLSNKACHAARAKYQLVTTVRVNNAASDEAYHAIFQQEDAQKQRGVKISRELSAQVNTALTKNFAVLGHQILPLTEKIWFVLSLLSKKLGLSDTTYVPNFMSAAEHICIHAGGRAIIDGMETTLRLSEEDCMPSRATLYRFGNTSSSSVWYELNYIEGCGSMRRGDKTIQVAFGSGIKCNSVVWRALHTIPPVSDLPNVFSWR